MTAKVLVLAWVGLATVSWSTKARADDKARLDIVPSLSLKFDNTSDALAGGPEVRTQWATRSGWNAFSVAFTGTANKKNKSDSGVTLAEGIQQYGAALALDYEIGTGLFFGNKFSDGAPQIFYLGLKPAWAAQKSSYTPVGGMKQTQTQNTLSLEVSAGGLISAGGAKASTTVRTTDPKTGKPIPVAVTQIDYSYWLLGPQFRFTYGATPDSDPDVAVVPPPAMVGETQVGQIQQVSAPYTRRKFEAVVALPVEPPTEALAFGPAVRWYGLGKKGSTSAANQYSRLRCELWFYAFVTNDATNARVGAAPFVDVRTYGTDSFDKIYEGLVVELRTGTSRLQY